MPKEADKTRDDVLRQMLKTPPKPHKSINKRRGFEPKTADHADDLDKPPERREKRD